VLGVRFADAIFLEPAKGGGSVAVVMAKRSRIETSISSDYREARFRGLDVIDSVAICPIAFNAFEELKTKLG